MAAFTQPFMPRLRLILSWLIFLALPLQGLAAASMQWCGPVLGELAQHALAGHAVGHGAGHDAGGHPADLSAHVPADHGDGDGGASPIGFSDPGASGASGHHGCTVCAFCVHGLAAGDGGGARLAGPVPEVLPGWTQVPLASPSLPVPDKPPRA